VLLINCLEVGGEWLLYILRPGVEGGEGLAVVIRVVVQLCTHEGFLVLRTTATILNKEIFDLANNARFYCLEITPSHNAKLVSIYMAPFFGFAFKKGLF